MKLANGDQFNCKLEEWFEKRERIRRTPYPPILRFRYQARVIKVGKKAKPLAA